MKTRSPHLANLKFPKKGSGQRTSYALTPGNFPDSVKEFVDQDYVSKLSRDEQLWLASFNNNYYGADFRSSNDGLENPPEWSTEERRQAYRAKNCANQDYYHIVRVRKDTIYIDVPPRLTPGVAASLRGHKQLEFDGDAVDFEIEAPDQDFSPAPAYLNSSEYKKALAEFRSTLKDNRGNLPPNKLSPKYQRASATLTGVVKAGLPCPELEPVPDKKEVDRDFPKPKRKEVLALTQSNTTDKKNKEQ